MKRTFFLGAVFCFAAVGACATYQQDLDRARRHYEQNHYEEALALFRVLEDDLDSLSPGDQAKYAYLRGMTDFRLAGLAKQPSGGATLVDLRRGYRSNARHWLAIAAAVENKTPGGLNEDEKKRMDETLEDLNHDIFGGSDSEQPPDAPKDGAAKTDGADKKTDGADKANDKP